MKIFDKWGHLLFRISDLKNTIYELKIPYWGINTIYGVKGKGYSGLRQYNDFPIFCDREEPHEKVKLIEQKEKPCWHVSKVIREVPIEPRPSFFGIHEVASQSLRLKEAIQGVI